MIDLRICAPRTGRLSDLLNRVASCNSHRIIIAGPMRIGAPGDEIMPSVIHPARSLYRLDSLPAAVAIAVAPPTVMAMVIPVTMMAMVIIPVIVNGRTKIVLASDFTDWRRWSGESARRWS